MKFEINNIRTSYLGFLLLELDFIEDYIEKVFKAGLKLISNELICVENEDEALMNYTYAVNEQLRHNLIKSSFLFLFSNYESSLFLVIRKLKYLKEGKGHPINTDDIKQNLNSISKLLEEKYLIHSNELSILQEIRNITIHRNGRLLPDELYLKEKFKMLKIGDKCIVEINETNNFLVLDEDIVYFSHQLIRKFYVNLIKLAQDEIGGK